MTIRYEQTPRQGQQRWPELLRPKQVGWILQLATDHVWEMIRARELPVVEIDGALRVPKAALFAWIEGLVAEQTAEGGQGQWQNKEGE